MRMICDVFLDRSSLNKHFEPKFSVGDTVYCIDSDFDGSYSVFPNAYVVVAINIFVQENFHTVFYNLEDIKTREKLNSQNEMYLAFTLEEANKIAEAKMTTGNDRTKITPIYKLGTHVKYRGRMYKILQIDIFQDEELYFQIIYKLHNLGKEETENSHLFCISVPQENLIGE